MYVCVWLVGVLLMIIEGFFIIDIVMLCMFKVDDLYFVVVFLGYFNLYLVDVEYGVFDGLVGYVVWWVQLYIYEDFVCLLYVWNIMLLCFLVMMVIVYNLNFKLIELVNILGVVCFGVVLLVDMLEDMGMVECQFVFKDKCVFWFVLIVKGVIIFDDIIWVVIVYDVCVMVYFFKDEWYMLLVFFNKLVLGLDFVF